MLALLAGIGGGWAFYLVWRRVLPRSRSREFWQTVPVHASGMLKSQDPDDLLRHYGALMKQAARFAGRNTLAVIVGLLPVTALFLLSGALYDDERQLAFLIGVVAGGIAAVLLASRASRATP